MTDQANGNPSVFPFSMLVKGVTSYHLLLVIVNLQERDVNIEFDMRETLWEEVL